MYLEIKALLPLQREGSLHLKLDVGRVLIQLCELSLQREVLRSEEVGLLGGWRGTKGNHGARSFSCFLQRDTKPTHAQILFAGERMWELSLSLSLPSTIEEKDVG